MGLVTNKNFIVSNAVENILSLTQKRPSKDMNWTQREEFGKVPKYLEEIKKEIAAEYAYIEQLHERQNNQNGVSMQLISEEERLKLLNSVQAKHDELLQVYNHQSFTIPAAKSGNSKNGTAAGVSAPQLDRFKITKKERLEAELDILEKYIEMLSKPNVLVM